MTVLIVLGVLYGVVGATQLRSSQQALQAARDSASQAQDAASSGDIDAAAGALNTGAAELEAAERRLGGSLALPIRVLPIARPNVGFVREAVTASASLSRDAGALLDTIRDEPDGVAAFAPSSGAIPIERIAALAEPVRALAQQAASAQQEVSQSFEARLLQPVAEAGTDLLQRLAGLVPAAQRGAALAEALPDLLGRSQPKRYFFAASTPAESRGAGGLIGAYTIATADAGRLTFGSFAPTVPLGNLKPDQIEAPDAEYARRYEQYGGAGFWQNINMTPDFPSAATAIERLYHARTGDTVDGVIIVDPFALQALLEVTGPVEIPEVGTVDASNVVATVSNNTYASFDTHVERKEVLGGVAARVFERFLSGDHATDNPLASLRALARVVGDRHLMIHSTDPAIQRKLEEGGIAGRLLNPSGDYLNVVGQNGSATKLDFYADRTITYDVTLDGDGSAFAQASTTLTNNAPTSGRPRYVIGPNVGDFEAGENVTIVNVYCARDCAVHRFTRNGVAEPMRAESELGHPVFWSYERLKSGQSVDLAYQWLLPNAWSGTNGNGHYKLTFQNQVTIRPTTFRLQLDLPPGMELIYSNPTLTQEAGQLVWQGQPRGDVEFDVHFRTTPGRFRRFIERQLNRLFD